MIKTIIWTPMELLLWGIGIASYIFIAFIFLYRGKQKDVSHEKVFLYGIGLIVFFTALHRLFYILSELQIEGEFNKGGFYGVTNYSGSLFRILYLMAFTSELLGMIFYTYALELNIKRTNFIFTISCSMLLISLLIISVILPFALAMSLMNTLFIVYIFITMAFTYTYLTKMSSPEFKTVIFFFLFFTECLMLTFLFKTKDFRHPNIVNLGIAPIFFIISIILLVIPLYVNPKFFSQKLTIWWIIDIFQIVISLILLVFFLSLNPIPFQNTIFILFFPIFITFILFQIRRDMKLKTTLGKPQEQQEVLATFIRPQKLTEEEVSISKEKKVCLVCKNPISRENYICPECNAFYCLKCSSTLAKMENACWACNSPFDESKPVKLDKKEEKVEIDEDIQKTSNGEIKSKE